jgi:hypothetical protein
MAKWSARRASIARRRPDGTFKTWRGGGTLADESDRRKTGLAGTQRHIEERFISQAGRPSKVGDLHRTRTRSGEFHKLAFWYVRTPHGWRKSPTETRRPSAREAAIIIANARPSSTTGALHSPAALHGSPSTRQWKNRRL